MILAAKGCLIDNKLSSSQINWGFRLGIDSWRIIQDTWRLLSTQALSEAFKEVLKPLLINLLELLALMDATSKRLMKGTPMLLAKADVFSNHTAMFNDIEKKFNLLFINDPHTPTLAFATGLSLSLDFNVSLFESAIRRLSPTTPDSVLVATYHCLGEYVVNTSQVASYCHPMIISMLHTISIPAIRKLSVGKFAEKLRPSDRHILSKVLFDLAYKE